MPGGLTARRFVRPLSNMDRPIALPHLELTGDVVLFLGEPLDRGLIGPNLVPLWKSCDGSRAVAAWPPGEQEILARWHAAGLLVAAPPARVRPAAPVTVVSPHPDDAQLALGGLLATTGGLVVDVFTEETWTRRPYYAARPALTTRLLLAEERIACQVLGVEHLLLGEVDGASRPAWAEGFFTLDSGDDRIATAEPQLFAAVVDRLRAALAPAGPVLVPLAIGGHVDHLIAREATLSLVAHGALSPERVAFYEDMPYTLFGDPTPLATALGLRGGWGPVRPVCLPVGCPDVKREALRVYRLQVTDGIGARVLRYGAKLSEEHPFAERIWAPACSTLLDPASALG